MKQAHKKRSPRVTANSPPVLPDMGKLLYKSGKFRKVEEEYQKYNYKQTCLSIIRNSYI